MIQLGVTFIRHNPVPHGAILTRAAGHRRINRGIDGALPIAALEGTKCQIVVPRDHGHLTVFFVQIVVVDHGAGVAVAVAHIVVNHEIADDLLYIHHRFDLFPVGQLFQRLNEPRLIGCGNIGLGVVPDVGVAGDIVINILQLNIRRPHAKATLATSEGGLAVLFGIRVVLRCTGHLRHIALHLGGIKITHVGHTATKPFGHLGRIKIAHIGHGSAKHGGGIKIASIGHPLVLLRTLLRAIRRFFTIHKIAHIEIFAVAPATTKAHAVRLVKFAVAGAVIALQEAVLYALHSQIQSPVLTVDGDIHKTAQRCRCTEGIHHGVGQIVLHHGGVLDQIVQAQLIKTMVGDGVIIVVKLHLKAVTIAVHGRNGGQGRIALAANAYVFIGFPVDHHSGGVVLLACGVINKPVPIVHDNINGMHPCIVEQTIFIAHGMCHGLNAQCAAIHKQNGNDQDQDCDNPCYFVKMFTPGHTLTPCSRRCRKQSQHCSHRAFRREC